MYVKFNINRELSKVARGKEARENVGVLLYIALDDQPAAQAAVARVFGIEGQQ